MITCGQQQQQQQQQQHADDTLALCRSLTDATNYLN